MIEGSGFVWLWSYAREMNENKSAPLGKILNIL